MLVNSNAIPSSIYRISVIGITASSSTFIMSRRRVTKRYIDANFPNPAMPIAVHCLPVAPRQLPLPDLAQPPRHLHRYHVVQ